MYSHTVLVPKTLTFEAKRYKCHKCGEIIEEHIICEGARFHVLHWDSNGTHCSVKNCEKNHKCRKSSAVQH